MLIPTLGEQSAIVAMIETVDTRLNQYQRRHVALTDLFRTLLHQLMTARIRVHDLDLPELETATQG